MRYVRNDHSRSTGRIGAALGGVERLTSGVGWCLRNAAAKHHVGGAAQAAKKINLLKVLDYVLRM